MESNYEEILVAKVWKYLQEGNENIVLSYNGNNDELQHFILRLSKGHDQKHEIETKFTSTIIEPLLGKRYVSSKFLIPVNKSFLEEINELIKVDRPLNRLHKEIDFGAEHAILSKNLLKINHRKSNLDTFSIEIKPKWGFLPTSPYIKVENQPKREKCRFCLHKGYKASEDKRSVSKYCPLLLYSEVEEDNICSFQALLETPQNNLRMFLNGTQLTIEEGLQKASDVFEIPESIIQLFLAKLVSKTFQRHKLLVKLKELQHKFDQYDIEGIFNIYNTLPKRMINEASLDQLKEIYLDFVSGNMILADKIELLSDDEKLKIIHEFLISATFKDCSILLSFSGSECEQLHCHEPLEFVTLSNKDLGVQGKANSQNIYFQLGVVDLDPKSIAKIPYYHQLDQEIIAHSNNLLRSND